ncbi:hypothetical protein EB796_000544 [Bugula neritina]|uniref:EF-hand domain-containing protein n=1 Tax=Bugula neritina TaxID=10212 RepID=A0A7J7KSW0_BUGNE|nr:hypothetical protein EB796_000544 [Bugula neritina]
MYDVRGSGQLSKEEFSTMLRSLMELANTSVEDSQIQEVIDSMFREAGMATKQTLTFDDFNKLLRDYKEQLDHANLNFIGMEPNQQPQAGGNQEMSRAKTVINARRENAPTRARKTVLKAYGEDRITRRQTHVEVKLKPRQAPARDRTMIAKKFTEFANYMENYRLHVFWVTLYALLSVAIFLERAYYFSVEREHAALRRICGYGVSITRGAASGMMWTYSTLLLTMCRNLITVLRETVLNRFIPLTRPSGSTNTLPIGLCFSQWCISLDIPLTSTTYLLKPLEI